LPHPSRVYSHNSTTTTFINCVVENVGDPVNLQGCPYDLLKSCVIPSTTPSFSCVLQFLNNEAIDNYKNIENMQAPNDCDAIF
jgi:hypothetical protein